MILEHIFKNYNCDIKITKCCLKKILFKEQYDLDDKYKYFFKILKTNLDK